jgi:hypothetical protein
VGACVLARLHHAGQMISRRPHNLQPKSPPSVPIPLSPLTRRRPLHQLLLWRARQLAGPTASLLLPRVVPASVAKLLVSDYAAEACALFLWAVDPLLDKAFELIRRWGFEYKPVGFYWVKQNRKSEGFFTRLGYWTRANSEQCLFATRGKPRRLKEQSQPGDIALG